MWTIIITLVIIGFVWAVFKLGKSGMRDLNHRRILGLRKPRNYDHYEKKSCKQFRYECEKHSIDVDWVNMPNLCTYLRILKNKGMHLELVKDGLTRYLPSSEEEYVGTEAWINDWGRIVFSPTIKEDDFCNCIRKIMDAHGFSEYENNIMPKLKSFDGLIESRDSFFIYRALHIMHYHILIRENNPKLKEYEVKNPKQMKGCPVDDVYELKPLKDLAKVKAGYKIWEQDITTQGNHPTIVYKETILSNSSGLKYRSGGVDIDSDIIVMGLEAPFDMRIWNGVAIIAEGVVSIEVTGCTISCEYLFLFLKLMNQRLKDNGVEEVKVEDLEATDVVVVPLHIQREIIRKGMPVKDDAEKLKGVFSAYYEAYPLLCKAIK